MRIAGVASAFPPQYYPQQVIADALQDHWSETMERPEYLGRFMARVGVEGRHLALPMDRYEALTDWGERNDHWIEVSEELAEQSICRALTRAGLCEADLDAIFFVSVTDCYAFQPNCVRVGDGCCDRRPLLQKLKGFRIR